VELVHEFTVPVPVERAWEVLTDVQRIAPCMPGAELTGVDGGTYHGLVKVKVGPISAQYKGTASFAEQDEASYRVVLKASGRDARGQGNAAATVTAQMTPAGDDATVVSIVTDLSISGRVAQFGRGVMGDVSARLLEQFVRNLEANVLTPGTDGGAGAGAGAASATAPGATTSDAGAPGTAAPGAAASAHVAGTDAVRPMGIIVRSVAARLGQSVARFFRRLAGRA
jgi:carbon monoxide dehydrogenase subunit G